MRLSLPPKEKNMLKPVTLLALIVLALGSAAVLPLATANPTDRFLARKTYKRRCTNYKCKMVSESTKPIFKCPHCGSSTVPVK